MFENRMLKRIFGSLWKEVTKGRENYIISYFIISTLPKYYYGNQMKGANMRHA
jgi:hypothetical protein